jgi:hypothetical protein
VYGGGGNNVIDGYQVGGYVFGGDGNDSIDLLDFTGVADPGTGFGNQAYLHDDGGYMAWTPSNGQDLDVRITGSGLSSWTQATPGGPSMVAPATASTTLVTGSLVNLSTMMAENGSDQALTYTWWGEGGNGGGWGSWFPSFSANNSNVAKNTTATFSHNGVYLFRVVATDPQGNANFSQVSVVVSDPNLPEVTAQGTAVGSPQFMSVLLGGAGPDHYSGGPVSSVRVCFSESMDPSTFTLADFTLKGPHGVAIPVTAVTPVSGSGNALFDVTFAPQFTPGHYSMYIAPNMLDHLGNAVGKGGWQYMSFNVLPPYVEGIQPQGPQGAVRVTFDKAINPASFTPAQVVSFRTVGSSAIPVTAVTPVAGSGNTQFDIAYNPASLNGGTVFGAMPSLSPTIADPAGNQLDQDLSGIGGQSIDGYTATVPSAPSASLTAANLTQGRGIAYTFNVTYTDPVGSLYLLSSSNLVVTGPHGFVQSAIVVGQKANSNGTTLVVQYQLGPGNGGTWSSADNGTYTVILQNSTVYDADSNTAPGMALGTFQVSI